VRPSDLVYRRRTERAGILFVIAVDASGSMARNRMREAKGAVLRLLRDAYVHRDEVALVVVRGAAASLLVPPTSSLARARQLLVSLPTGGGTPLASGIALVARVVRAARVRDLRPALAVFLTDGRANVPLDGKEVGDVQRELEHTAHAFVRERILALVFDSRPGHDRRQDAAALARMLGARWFRLADGRGEQLAETVRTFGHSAVRNRRRQ
jgi:magnesium chelatase subunit D